MKSLTQAEKGAADDIAAKQVGLSRPTAVKGAKVVQAIDKLIVEGKRDEAEQLRQVLNGQSFDAAIQAAVQAGHIEQPPPKKSTTTPKPPADKKGGNAPPVTTRVSTTNKGDVSTDAGGSGADQSPVKPHDATAGENAGGNTETAGTSRNPPDGHEEPERPYQATVGSGLPPIVLLTESMNKFVDGHGDLDLGDVSNDQKWNFNRAFESLSDWCTDHAVMLRLPGQPS